MEKLTKKKRFIAMIYITAIILVTATVGVGVYDFNVKEGSLIVDGKKTEVKTKSDTVKDLLNEKKLKMNEKDEINLALDEKIKDGFNIEIKRALPVAINIENKRTEIKTTKNTVKQVLDSLSVYYDENDKINPSLDTKISSNLEINVVKVDELVQTQTEEIKYEVVTKNNTGLEKGKTLKVQEGIKGIKETKFKAIYENGVLVSKEPIESNVIREPISEVLEKGTKDIVIASRSSTRRTPPTNTNNINNKKAVGSNQVAKVSSNKTTASKGPSLEGKKSIMMTATAYDLSFESTGKRPGDQYYGLTASGTQVRPGVVAVDPKVIPLGSKLYVEYADGSGAYGYAVAEDTGGAIKGNRIDLFFSSRAQALAFGIKQVKVYIL
ncbi:3D domain-containing protein [Gottschalkia purinilytica]|uniref:3D domain-containing protein n=1 Tax=Gottschalkia purinilytica TaxID=1503 RepID=A0A0L0WEC0_GOTPU|nr:3D domain-containing protein [Gottschalkia purinilytica]KNF09814.1 3D domain-containing protein [Gottschalkia purinilytica]